MGAAAGMDVNELTSVFNESVGEIVQTMVNSGYSQTQEFDADNTAMSLMASAGYNPQGLLEMLRSLGTGGGPVSARRTRPRNSALKTRKNPSANTM